jgi:hypothetical protein
VAGSRDAFWSAGVAADAMPRHRNIRKFLLALFIAIIIPSGNPDRAKTIYPFPSAVNITASAALKGTPAD